MGQEFELLKNGNPLVEFDFAVATVEAPAGCSGPSPVDVRAALYAWNGYQPTPSQQRALDAELDRRLCHAES